MSPEDQKRTVEDVMRRLVELGWFEALPASESAERNMRITAKGSVALSPLFQFLDTYNDEALTGLHLNVFWGIVTNIHRDIE